MIVKTLLKQATLKVFSWRGQKNLRIKAFIRRKTQIKSCTKILSTLNKEIALRTSKKERKLKGFWRGKEVNKNARPFKLEIVGGGGDKFGF